MKGLPLIDSCELENKKKKLRRKRVRLSLGVQQETVLYALQQSLLNSILQLKIVSFQSKISAWDPRNYKVCFDYFNLESNISGWYFEFCRP